MTIRRRCTEWSCKDGRRCLEHLRFDVMWRGKRYRMAANEFAIPRMEPGKQRPIQSMEEARDWERLFIGEVKAGRDPIRPPSRATQAGAQIGDVAAFLDAYWERCVKPAGLRSLGSVRSQISILKQHLGQLPLSALEEPDEINRFKTDSEYADDEEKRLLDTALGVMNTAPHQYVGEMLHDRIIGALELCCRRGEMLLIQNKRVNWDTCQIGIPGATAKDKENRRIPFNPSGRLAAILTRRAALGSHAYVFG